MCTRWIQAWRACIMTRQENRSGVVKMKLYISIMKDMRCRSVFHRWDMHLHKYIPIHSPSVGRCTVQYGGAGWLVGRGLPSWPNDVIHMYAYMNIECITDGYACFADTSHTHWAVVEDPRDGSHVFPRVPRICQHVFFYFAFFYRLPYL